MLLLTKKTLCSGNNNGGSRILKRGVNFCNNVREIKYYFNIWGIRTKKKEEGSEKGGWKFTHFTSPGSAPEQLPCLFFLLKFKASRHLWMTLSCQTAEQGPVCNIFFSASSLTSSRLDSNLTFLNFVFISQYGHEKEREVGHSFIHSLIFI